MTDRLREAAQHAWEVLDEVYAWAPDGSTSKQLAGEAFTRLGEALSQYDAQTVPTQRQYEMALRQWDHWKSYALELQAKLVKYEGGSPMVLNAAPTPPAQQDAQAVDFDDAYASTTMALVEDYAKAVHDGDDAVCSVLRQTIKASLEQAAPTPPQRVALTDDEIEQASVKGGGTHSGFARAVIEAYERKNGLKP